MNEADETPQLNGDNASKRWTWFPGPPPLAAENGKVKENPATSSPWEFRSAPSAAQEISPAMYGDEPVSQDVSQ